MDVARHHEDGVRRTVERVVETADDVHVNLLEMRQFLPDRKPLIRVVPVTQTVNVHHQVAVRLVEAGLLELLHHHLLLHVESLLAEGEGGHAVGFQPKGGLYVVGRQYNIVAGEVL